MRHRFARQRIRMGQPIHMRLLTGPLTIRRSSRSASDIRITAAIVATIMVVITADTTVAVVAIIAAAATIVAAVAIMVVITLMAIGKH